MTLEKAAQAYADKQNPVYSDIRYWHYQLQQAYLAGYLKARELQEWVKLSEQKPEEGQWVLLQGQRYNEPQLFWLFAGYGQYTKGRFMPDTDSISGHDYDVDEIENVTHWMPLPKLPSPPKEQVDPEKEKGEVR